MTSSLPTFTNAQLDATSPILLIALSNQFDSIQRNVMTTASALHQQARPYAVVAIEDSPLHQATINNNLDCIPLPYRAIDPRTFFALLRTMQQSRVQIVDCYDLVSQLVGMGAAVAAGVPQRIASVHAGPHKLRPNKHRWLQRQVLRLNALSGSRFVATSQTLANYVGMLGAKHVDLIYSGANGKPASAAQQSSSAQNDLIPKTWPEDKFVVTYVGQLSAERGVENIIDAVYHEIREHEQLRCLIVGEGKLKAKLQQRIETFDLTDYIHIAPPPADLARVWQQTNIACIPTVAEMLPATIFDAAHHQLPLLLTKTNSYRELFLHQESAFLADVDNVLDLAEGIDWLISSPEQAQAIGRKAKSDLSHFTQTASIDAMLAIYS